MKNVAAGFAFSTETGGHVEDRTPDCQDMHLYSLESAGIARNAAKNRDPAQRAEQPTPSMHSFSCGQYGRRRLAGANALAG